MLGYFLKIFVPVVSSAIVADARACLSVVLIFQSTTSGVGPFFMQITSTCLDTFPGKNRILTCSNCE